jgi:hypothetical protein
MDDAERLRQRGCSFLRAPPPVCNPWHIHAWCSGWATTARSTLGLLELRRGGQPVPLEPQAFDVLAYLVSHRRGPPARSRSCYSSTGLTPRADRGRCPSGGGTAVQDLRVSRCARLTPATSARATATPRPRCAGPRPDPAPGRRPGQRIPRRQPRGTAGSQGIRPRPSRAPHDLGVQ